MYEYICIYIHVYVYIYIYRCIYIYIYILLILSGIRSVCCFYLLVCLLPTVKKRLWQRLFLDCIWKPRRENRLRQRLSHYFNIFSCFSLGPIGPLTSKMLLAIWNHVLIFTPTHLILAYQCQTFTELATRDLKQKWKILHFLTVGWNELSIDSTCTQMVNFNAQANKNASDNIMSI